MLLVHENKDEPGKWQVAWTWLPHFIATNPDAVNHVVDGLNERFKGVDPTDSAVEDMHHAVIDLVLEKYPWPGLKQYLRLITEVHPEEAGAAG